MFEERERTKASAYYECRQMIEDCGSIPKLQKVIDQVMATARTHKFDDEHMEKLEAVGIRVYERITRDTQMAMKNKKF